MNYELRIKNYHVNLMSTIYHALFLIPYSQFKKFHDRPVNACSVTK